MSNDTPNDSAAQRDRYDVHHVKNVERHGETKDFWTRVGVAFPHKDGKGFNVELDLLPPNGKLVLRKYEPKSEQ